MKLLEDRIRREGRVLPGNVLKVDGFLNHQIDTGLFAEMGREFYRLFQNDSVNKIVTIEASGIGLACLTAYFFETLSGHKVPVVFAKKQRTANQAADVYTASVESFTHGRSYQAGIAKQYLSPVDRVLIIDDFLANGCALGGLRQIVEQSGAVLVGAGVAIEKGFQDGGKLLRESGLRVESLAVIDRMDESGVVIRK